MKTTKDIYVFDMDGTITCNQHRLHHLLKQDKDWDAYFEAMQHDTLNEPIARLMHDLFEGGAVLYICTTRTEQYRLMTEEWLDDHLIPYHCLLMAQDDDDSPHHEIKAGMLKFLRDDGYQIVLAVDDRPSVVQMWRDNGVQCLALDDKDWKLEGNVDVDATDHGRPASERPSA